MFLPHPRGFRDLVRVKERMLMLDTDAATAPLVAYARDLAQRRGVHVPQFDPAEAGIDAKVLFVFEAPGPMTNTSSRRPGSGFISVDNDDATAANMWAARSTVGLHDGVLCWNIVPWYLGPASVKPSRVELASGAEELARLMSMLTYLEVVVLAGRYAQTGWARYLAPVVRNPPAVVNVWHPSPLSLNQPGRREEFVRSMAQIALLVEES